MICEQFIDFVKQVVPSVREEIAEDLKEWIRHYQGLQDNYIKKYDEINEGLQAMINVLQELLEGRK